MAAGFVGADIQQLKDLAAQMTSAGSSLGGIEGKLTALVSNARWTGGDAAAFTSDWHRTHRVSLRTVTQTLQATAVELRRNAAEQEAASQAGGGASGGASGSVPGGGADNVDTLKDFANDTTPNPEDVAEWWNDLSDAEKAALIKSNPELIGNLEGVDYTSRSEANHENLDNLIDAAEKRGDDKAVEYLNAVKDAAAGNQPKKQLISVEGGPPPLAAISVGNLDKADYTTILVPGMGSNGATTPGDLTAAAADLRREQRAIAGANGLSKDIAVVAWMAYDSPEMPGLAISGDTDGNVTSVGIQADVMGNTHAIAGGEKLTAAILGYDAVREGTGNGGTLNVVAHSYGSTTAAYTLADLPNGVVDSFTTLGSAGIDPSIGGAAGLNVPQDNVYAIQGIEAIPAAVVGRVGSGRDDPSNASWGATRLNSNLELNLFGTSTIGSNVHDLATNDNISAGYLDPGTTSLKNTALVGLGFGDEASRY